MSKNIKITILIIFSLLFSSQTIFSQTTNFWEPVIGLPSVINNELLGRVEFVTIADNGDIWTVALNYTLSIYMSLYLSTDNGNSWVEKALPFSNTSQWSIAVNPINGYIFAGNYQVDFADAGLFRSTDNGESWVKVIIILIRIVFML